MARKPWQDSVASAGKRLRGRAGMKARREVLIDEPLCRSCLAADIVTASTVVDHIVPLAWGGSDERSNKQGLCKACHNEKSKREAAQGARLGGSDR